MASNIPTKIKNEAILFAGMNSKPTSDGLREQARRNCRTQQYHAIDARGVEPLGQNVAIDKPTKRAVLEVTQRGVSLQWCRVANNEATPRISLISDRLLNSFRVRNTGGKDNDRFPTGGFGDHFTRRL